MKTKKKQKALICVIIMPHMDEINSLLILIYSNINDQFPFPGCQDGLRIVLYIKYKLSTIKIFWYLCLI